MTNTFNTKIVFKTLGALLLIEAFFMVWPTLVSYFYHEPDTLSFGASVVLTVLGSLLGFAVGRNAPRKVGEREGYTIVALVWIVFSFFGMLPFYLSGSLATITDAFFETMAGFSTFGGTVYSDVESLTHGILFWRSLMQWLGGLGIIVLSIAILPMFGLGGMQLYAAEVTGVSYEKLGPRISGTAKSMWMIYIALTLAEMVLLCLFGMEGFDSICHSMTTIATGGFSTKNTSVMTFNPAIQYTIGIFMVLSGINFTLLIFGVKGKAKRLWKDEETRWYLLAILFFTGLLFVGLFTYYGLIEPEREFSTWRDYLAHGEESFRHAFFMVGAAITSTGFASTDYMLWPHLLWVALFIMMLLGGCAGSTSGGIKQIRVILLMKNSLAECKRRIHPNAIITAKVNGKPVGRQTMDNISAFFFWYIVIVVVTILIFCATGLDFENAVGTAFSAIGNVGITIGDYGPSGSYANFPVVAKWWASLVMVVGRLEIFTILLLFSPTLWKK